MKTINIGIIGFGYMGKMHTMCYENLKYYYALDAQINLYAVVSHKFQDELPVKFQVVYDDYHQLIEDDKVDVIDICMPNYMHKEILIEAIKHNKYIYCEKPLTINLKESKKVMEAYKKYNYSRSNRVTFEYRFVPAIIRAKQIIEEGKLGKIVQFNCKYYGSEFLDPNRCISWQSTKEKSGGGVLYALGTHAVDLINYLVGDVAKVYGEKKTYFDKRPVMGHPEIKADVEIEDILNIMLTCKNGAMGTLLLSQVAAGAGVDLSFEIYGEHGAVKFDQSEPNIIKFYDDTEAKSPTGGYCGYKSIETMQKYGGAAVFPPPRVNISWSRYHIASVYDFIKGITEDTITIPNLEDGYKVSCVTDAIYRSCESGQPERVEEA